MFKQIHYTEIDSTNLEAQRIVRSGNVVNKTIISANLQTNGQGSRGRYWSSDESGNLLATYILPIDQTWPQKSYLALYPVAYAVLKFLKNLLPEEADIKLKWPNDVLVNQKKICGMLHMIEEHDGQKYFIAGIGVNLVWYPEITSTAFPPTCLTEHTQRFPRLKKLITNLGGILENEISLWSGQDFPAYLEQLLPHFYGYQDNITIYPTTHKNCAITGIFQEISEEGALLLKTDEDIKKITAGDIFPHL